MQTSPENVTSWRKTLLEDPVAPEFRDSLVPFLKKIGQDFLDNTVEHLAPDEKAAADRWYHSEEGQETLKVFTQKTWNQMFPLADHAMPAHDARHAMFKVPLSALEYVVHENVQGHERIGVLGALLHDHGRWAEERIFGGPGSSLVHARLSFLLTRELLEGFDMPAGVKSQLLLAVIRHTSGANPEDPMALKLTVSADRDQLYGPEMVLRLMHHGATGHPAMASVYAELHPEGILDRLEHMQRNRLPGPLFGMQSHVDWLRWVQRMFLLMAETAEESRQRFAVDLPGGAREGGSKKRLLGLVEGSVFEWETEWKWAHSVMPLRDCARTELDLFLNARNLAPSRVHRTEALAKLDCLSALHQPLLAGALAWVREQQCINDQRQAIALRQLLATRNADSLIGTLASLLLAHG